ncbi:hypothetical protein [Carnobacterium maltaromaticum]|uniref:hypothetical protein n=1 Tax=Carnobacterium maltaromaticum TaxID=2751 RepID=UPI0012FC4D59|nr:hypothetical protein [Carnobacterium maltaromaticum]
MKKHGCNRSDSNRSYRTKALDAIDGLLIDEACDTTKIDMDVGVPVYFGKISDS